MREDGGVRGRHRDVHRGEAGSGGAVFRCSSENATPYVYTSPCLAIFPTTRTSASRLVSRAQNQFLFPHQSVPRHESRAVQAHHYCARPFREHSSFAVASNDQDGYCKGQTPALALLCRSGCLSGTALTLRHVFGLLGKWPSFVLPSSYLPPCVYAISRLLVVSSAPLAPIRTARLLPQLLAFLCPCVLHPCAAVLFSSF